MVWYMEAAYRHGGYAETEYEEYTDFSASIAPLGLPVRVREAVLSSIKKAESYPDPFCTGLREAIAKRLGTDRERVIPGNGACDLIYRIAQAFRGLIREALIVEPAFCEYEKALLINGIGVRHYLPENPLLKADIRGILKSLDSGCPDTGLFLSLIPQILREPCLKERSLLSFHRSAGKGRLPLLLTSALWALSGTAVIIPLKS